MIVTRVIDDAAPVPRSRRVSARGHSERPAPALRLPLPLPVVSRGS